MWIQAGFTPDSFWPQTPRHFQLAMEGVRKRLTSEGDARTAQAWETAAFNAQTKSKAGLKPLNQILRKQAKRQSPKEMLAYIQQMGRGSNMKVRQIRISGEPEASL